MPFSIISSTGPDTPLVLIPEIDSLLSSHFCAPLKESWLLSQINKVHLPGIFGVCPASYKQHEVLKYIEIC